MKPLTCEMCGSTNLIKENGVFVCQSCGTKFSVEEAKKMMVEGTVSIAGTVAVEGCVKIDVQGKLENLYELARRAKGTDDFVNAQKYYNEILIMDPKSWEATFYSEFSRAKLLLISTHMCNHSAIDYLGKCLPTTFSLISEYIADEQEQEQCVYEVVKCTSTFASAITENARSSIKNATISIGAGFIGAAASGLNNSCKTYEDRQREEQVKSDSYLVQNMESAISKASELMTILGDCIESTFPGKYPSLSAKVQEEISNIKAEIESSSADTTKLIAIGVGILLIIVVVVFIYFIIIVSK